MFSHHPLTLLSRESLTRHMTTTTLPTSEMIPRIHTEKRRMVLDIRSSQLENSSGSGLQEPTNVARQQNRNSSVTLKPSSGSIAGL